MVIYSSIGRKSMNNARPINLDLASVSWPVTAIASILHRICAVIIWVGLAFLLPTIMVATSSEEGFESVATLIQTNFLAQFVAWGLLTALGYYCMGTIKHLIQDMGFFESFDGGKTISWTAIALGILISIASGALIWL